MDEDVAEPSRQRERGTWYKSSYSTGACTCFEVRFVDGLVHLRDSKFLLDPDNDPASQPTIAIPAGVWSLVLAEFVGELPTGVNGVVDLHVAPDGSATVTCRSTRTKLAYDADEVEAFRAGVIAGEFLPVPTG